MDATSTLSGFAEWQTGKSRVSRIFTIGDATGDINMYFNADIGNGNLMILDSQNNLRGQGKSLSVPLLNFSQQVAAPAAPREGDTTLSDGTGWRPLAGQTTPRMVIYRSGAWVALNSL